MIENDVRLDVNRTYHFDDLVNQLILLIDWKIVHKIDNYHYFERVTILSAKKLICKFILDIILN